MSKWEKLIERIMKLNSDLRFDELEKALVKMGYTKHQPKSGSSHYTFRKEGCMPVTNPKHTPLKKTYIEIVKNIIIEQMEKEEQ